MAEHKHSEQPAADGPQVSCEVCLREIPETEARSAEGEDYTLYFCGLDCYHRWRQKAEAAKGS